MRKFVLGEGLLACVYNYTLHFRESDYQSHVFLDVLPRLPLAACASRRPAAGSRQGRARKETCETGGRWVFLTSTPTSLDAYWVLQGSTGKMRSLAKCAHLDKSRPSLTATSASLRGS